MEIICTIDVKNFLYSLDFKTQARTSDLIDTLEILGQKIRPPESKKIGEKLFELRLIGKPQVRILYTVIGGKAYLLNGFIKKSWKLPLQEIDKAKMRIKMLA